MIDNWLMYLYIYLYICIYILIHCLNKLSNPLLTLHPLKHRWLKSEHLSNQITD
jgi:hypothetical protein